MVNKNKLKHDSDDDDPELLFDDDFSSVGIFDVDDEISSSIKCKRQATLVEATVGKKQERSDKTKRKIKPTNRFCTNVALKDRQHLYATEGRTYQQNRALLTTPKMKSNVLPTLGVSQTDTQLILLFPPGELLPRQPAPSQGGACIVAGQYSPNHGTRFPVFNSLQVQP
jgi:hypothetical protein